MTRTLRILAVCALAALMALSTFAQERPLVGTVLDVDEGRARLQIESDGDRTSRLTIEIDAVATTWNGFGTMISGKPEIFTGASGLANVRLGDRIEIRGSSRGEGVHRADQITLLGREVAAPQVGVGQTRAQTSVATPTEEQARAASASFIEGTIRQINLSEGRLVIQTTQRRMVGVRASRSTVVWYRGEQYRVANLETGDRIRVEIDPRDSRAEEIIAHRIEVVQSVQESDTPPTGARVTTIRGKIVRVEPGLDYAYLDDGRSEIRIDMSRGEDAEGEAMHARDLRAGDQVEISGSFNRVGDMFLASRVRFGSTVVREPDDARIPRYEVVTVIGTVVDGLDDAATISVRDRDSGDDVAVWVIDDLVVRTRADGYTTADRLRSGDSVVVAAFRDAGGNLIAQTIRLRNR